MKARHYNFNDKHALASTYHLSVAASVLKQSVDVFKARYSIGKTLGAGEFAIVKLAVDTETNEKVPFAHFLTSLIQKGRHQVGQNSGRSTRTNFPRIVHPQEDQAQEHSKDQADCRLGRKDCHCDGVCGGGRTFPSRSKGRKIIESAGPRNIHPDFICC